MIEMWYMICVFVVWFVSLFLSYYMHDNIAYLFYTKYFTAVCEKIPPASTYLLWYRSLFITTCLFTFSKNIFEDKGECRVIE